MVTAEVSWGEEDVTFNIQHDPKCDDGDVEAVLQDIYDLLYPDPIIDENGEEVNPEFDSYTIYVDGTLKKISASDVAGMARIEDHIYGDLVEHCSVYELASLGWGGYIEYSSGAEYVERLLDDTGELENVPPWLRGHINLQSAWDCDIRHDVEYYEIGDNGRIVIAKTISSLDIVTES